MISEENGLSIIEIGMVSSIGLDWETACASERAGIARATELEFTTIDSETKDREPVVGHPLALGTRGFQGKGRLLRIGQLALEELQNRVDISNLGSGQCGFVLSVPENMRNSSLINDSENNQADLVESDGSQNYFDIKTLSLLIESTDFNQSIGSHHIVHGGHAGFAFALKKASEIIAENRYRACIVGAIDSLLDSESLQWLNDSNRLKCSGNPAGLQPGEAGVFFLISRDEKILVEQGSLGKINSVVVTREEDHQATGRCSSAKGLTDAFIQLDNELENGLGRPWLLGDLNGEKYRAMEWSNALTRLGGELSSIASSDMTFPASSFGDTETASGAVNLSLALAAFKRGYASSRHALVVSSATKGERGIISIEKYC